MATIGTSVLTLQDWASRQENDKVATVVEILMERNPIIEDMAWEMGNLPTGHKTTIRSGLPAPTWRLLNYGVQPKKSKTVQVTDSIGMLENYSKVDKALAHLNGDVNAFRMSEDIAFIQGMNNDFASTLFYGNTATDPEKFMGLSPRYNLTTAENGENILDGGGTGSNNTSIWLIVWGNQTAHGIFPKGSPTGLQVQDLGEDTLTDDAGGEYQGYRTHYKWDAGFTLRDWQYVVRIANIDVSALTNDASAGADLIDLLAQAVELPPTLTMGRPVIYANKTITSFLRRQVSNKSNVNLTLDNAGGKSFVSFDGIPVRKCDALLLTEATVS